MGPLQKLEDALVAPLTKNAPVQLPENAKKWLVKYLPIINLVLGILSLWAVLQLWRWAHVTDDLVDTANRISAIYGGDIEKVSRLTATFWLSLIVLAIQAVLYIAAYPGLKAKKKSGWNLLFYAALVNFAYGVVSVFSDYSYGGGLIGTIVGTGLGLYFLFQIRSNYTDKKA